MKYAINATLAVLLLGIAAAEQIVPCNSTAVETTSCKKWESNLRKASVLYIREVASKEAPAECNKTYCEKQNHVMPHGCTPPRGSKAFCTITDSQPKGGSKKRIKVGMTKAGQLLTMVDMAETDGDTTVDEICEWDNVTIINGTHDVVLLQTPSFSISGTFMKRVPGLLIDNTDNSTKNATTTEQINAGVYYYQMQKLGVSVYTDTGDLAEYRELETGNWTGIQENYDLDGDDTDANGDKPDGSKDKAKGKPDGSKGKAKGKGKGKISKIMLTAETKSDNLKILRMDISVGNGTKAKCRFSMMNIKSAGYMTIFFKCNIAQMMLDGAAGVLATGGCPGDERNKTEMLSAVDAAIAAKVSRKRRQTEDPIVKLTSQEPETVQTEVAVAETEAQSAVITFPTADIEASTEDESGTAITAIASLMLLGIFAL